MCFLRTTTLTVRTTTKYDHRGGGDVYDGGGGGDTVEDGGGCGDTVDDDNDDDNDDENNHK